MPMILLLIKIMNITKYHQKILLLVLLNIYWDHTKTWEEVYQLIEAVTPRKLINFTCFKQQYNRKIVNTRKYSYSKCFLDLHFLFMNNDEDDNNKRQKFDEEVDYKKLYEDLLCPYRELEYKYKSLEETNVDLEEKLRSLEQSIFGKNKKIGGIKSALSRVKKSNTAVLPNDVSNANLGTEVIVKHTTLASKSVQIFSGYEMQRDNNTSDFKNIRGRHKCMVYCRLGEESCGPITTLTSAKQKKNVQNLLLNFVKLLLLVTKLIALMKNVLHYLLNILNIIQVYLKLFPDI